MKDTVGVKNPYRYRSYRYDNGTVQELSVKETKEILHIYIDGEEIKTTANHPFWIEAEGWN